MNMFTDRQMCACSVGQNFFWVLILQLEKFMGACYIVKQASNNYEGKEIQSSLVIVTYKFVYSYQVKEIRMVHCLMADLLRPH